MLPGTHQGIGVGLNQSMISDQLRRVLDPRQGQLNRLVFVLKCLVGLASLGLHRCSHQRLPPRPSCQLETQREARLTAGLFFCPRGYHSGLCFAVLGVTGLPHAQSHPGIACEALHERKSLSCSNRSPRCRNSCRRPSLTPQCVWSQTFGITRPPSDRPVLPPWQCPFPPRPWIERHAPARPGRARTARPGPDCALMVVSEARATPPPDASIRFPQWASTGGASLASVPALPPRAPEGLCLHPGRAVAISGEDRPGAGATTPWSPLGRIGLRHSSGCAGQSGPLRAQRRQGLIYVLPRFRTP